MFYNDAYRPLMGNKHPGADAAGAIRSGARSGPPSARCSISVLRTGQATWSEDLLLPMNRHGYWEEDVLDLLLQPAARTMTGTVRGGVHRGQGDHRGGGSAAAGSPCCRTSAPRPARRAAWPRACESGRSVPGAGPPGSSRSRPSTCAGPDGEAILARSSAPGRARHAPVSPGGWPVGRGAARRRAGHADRRHRQVR